MEKTLADAANKAVDSLANGGERLADTIEKVGAAMADTAPHIWRELVEYHRVLAFGELVLSGFICLACTLLSAFAAVVWIKGAKLSSKAKAEYAVAESHDERSMCTSAEEFGIMFRVLAGVVVLAAFIGSVTTAHGIPETAANYAVPERAAALEIIQAAGILK